MRRVYGLTVEQERERVRAEDASAARGPALITAEEVGVRFGRGDSLVWAVRSASVQLPQNEMTAIVGPSGSGKSTLLYMLAGLVRPSEGRVMSGGTDLTRASERQLARWRRDNVGMIFQNYNLVPYLTVRQNIELPARLARRPHDARSALAAVSLAGHADSYPSQLSGGQQQRVAIARILASPPPLVLADEPTGALDSIAGAEVVDLLAALPGDGIAVALVTHDLTAAARAARAVVMRDGRTTADVVAPTADRLFELMTGSG